MFVHLLLLISLIGRIHKASVNSLVGPLTYVVHIVLVVITHIRNVIVLLFISGLVFLHFGTKDHHVGYMFGTREAPKYHWRAHIKFVSDRVHSYSLYSHRSDEEKKNWLQENVFFLKNLSEKKYIYIYIFILWNL